MGHTVKKPTATFKYYGIYSSDARRARSAFYPCAPNAQLCASLNPHSILLTAITLLSAQLRQQIKCGMGNTVLFHNPVGSGAE